MSVRSLGIWPVTARTRKRKRREHLFLKKDLRYY